jgi:hypothetical protein
MAAPENTMASKKFTPAGILNGVAPTRKGARHTKNSMLPVSTCMNNISTGLPHTKTMINHSPAEQQNITILSVAFAQSGDCYSVTTKSSAVQFPWKAKDCGNVKYNCQPASPYERGQTNAPIGVPSQGQRIFSATHFVPFQQQ